ncbi:MAG: CRISPR-associated protein Cas4, partial [Candidatus Nanohalobium sp.]
MKHESQSDRGGWVKEQYFSSEDLGLQGKIDIIDEKKQEAIPVERKRGEQYYYNDEIQLAAYCMLFEQATGEKISEGTIYLYGTDQRLSILIEEHHREKVKETIEKMRNLNPDNPPPIIDNRNKCKG